MYKSSTIDSQIFLSSADGLCAIRVATNVQGYNRESTTNGHLASAVDAILDICLQKEHRGGYIAGVGESSGLLSTVYLTADRIRRSSPHQRNLQHRRPTHSMFRHTEGTTHGDRL